MNHPLPLSLYIHIPWCVRKCPYCDFNSHESKEIPQALYLAALLADLKLDQPLAQGRALQTIFIGGGTPSLMPADFYAELLQRVNQVIPIADNAEITLEANPGTFEYQKFRGFYQAGINRLSIGVQSFNADHLKVLGRIHSSDEAKNAIKAAQDVGFEKINIDLMHGLPNQTTEQAMADLNQAIELQTSHLSWYQLTIEPNTVFYNKPPTLPQEDRLHSIETNGFAMLDDQGFQHYETSAYAKPGFQCLHNLNYWLFGDYIGIGAGAHGKISTPATDSIVRYQKTRLPQDYLDPDKAFTAKTSAVLHEDRAFEFFMNSLRLQQPINQALFSARTFMASDSVAKPIQKAIAADLLLEQNQHWQTTELGQRFLNTLLNYFIE